MGTVVSGMVLAAVVTAFVLAVPRLRAHAERRARTIVLAAESLRALSRGDYLRRSALDAWRGRGHDRAQRRLGPVGRALLDPALRKASDEAARMLVDPEAWADQENEKFVEGQLAVLGNWFENRLPHPLTAAQRRAVLVDEDANLVIAGAGAGKTSTLLARIAYLIEERGESPDRILVLAFNASVADELEDRILAMGLPSPEISTFHAKGFAVLGEAEGRKPAVSSLASDNRALRSLLQSEFERTMADPRRRKAFARWWVRFRVSPEDLEGCDTPDERLRREQSFGLRTLTGVRVASIAEVKVADWLTLQGITWEHEKRYPFAPPTSTHRDYTPDFYLPDHDLWLEVWSCDRAEVDFPPQIDREAYAESMRWKRELHQTHGTHLVEVFQDDVWGPDLDGVLERAIPDHPATDSDASGRPDAVPTLSTIRSGASPFVALLSTFLRLYRAGGWTRDTVARRVRTDRDRAFLEIFWPFLTRYEFELQSEEKIDFDEMLIRAAALAADGRYEGGYRYILVDEFQDTSRARMLLIEALRGERSNCRVFAVGDDWQSIYRFAGSDVAYFADGEKHLGPTARTILPDTFRLESDVAALSTRFVLRNPAQVAKKLHPRRETRRGPGVSLHLHGPNGEREVAQRLMDEVAAEGEGTRLLVLARYNHRLGILKELVVPGGLEVRASTVHRAKGLEADTVILLGLDAGSFGFPTEIRDDHVLELLLEGDEALSNAEERRLFYVALTRTRTRVHILADARNASPFAEELGGEGYAQWVEVRGTGSVRHRCPNCAGMTITRVEGSHGPFWACSHYPACHGRLPTCPSCREGVLAFPFGRTRGAVAQCSACRHGTTVCPKCVAGVLVERSGPYGRFTGCTGWRPDGSGCDFTRDGATPVEG
ncbi:MAG: UvrD-helicase domain-containing protein [Longimicrobiales bacterium]